MKILIVGEKDASRAYLAELLTGEGYTVRECHNGQEALRTLYLQKYDMILSGIKMPRMTGIELLKAVKALPEASQAPVVLITEHASFDTAVEALRAGAYDYLLKPIDIKKLLGLVEEISQQISLKGAKEKKVTVLVRDDRSPETHEILRLLEMAQGYACLGRACALEECFVQMEEHSPDILVLAIGEGEDASLCRSLKERCESTAIVVYSGLLDPLFVLECIQGGADAFVVKPCSNVCDLVYILQKVSQGGIYLDPTFLKELIRGQSLHITETFPSNLTHQEKNVLQHLVKGKTNKEIAQELFLSPGTVRNYVSRIMKKTGASNRASLVLWGSKYFWLGKIIKA